MGWTKLRSEGSGYGGSAAELGEIDGAMAVAINETKAAVTSSSHSNISSSSRHSRRSRSLNKSSTHSTRNSSISSGYPKGIEPPCVCFRCDQPGHFHNDSRAIPPPPINTYSPAPSHSAPLGESRVANYSSTSLGKFISSSGGDCG